MAYELKRLAKNTIEITYTIPWNEIKKTYDKMLDEVVVNAEIQGFRKGKAPRDLVEKNLNKDSFFDEILNKIIPDLYKDAVETNKLKPIVYPKIEVLSKNADNDWIFKVTICEEPKIDLGNYKEEFQTKNAKDKIWIPGKEEKKEEEKPDKNKKLTQNLEVLIKTAKLELPDLLIDDETTKLLSQLLEEIKKLGLSLEQYLASTHKTVEILRDEYKEKAINSLKLEFILSHIADAEKITISDEEIKTAVAEITDEKLKEDLNKSNYQLASLLRRQKTLDFIADL